MSLSTLLDTATMAKLFETRDHIRASLIKSARTDGNVNTITLKDDTSYDDALSMYFNVIVLTGLVSQNLCLMSIDFVKLMKTNYRQC